MSAAESPTNKQSEGCAPERQLLQESEKVRKVGASAGKAIENQAGGLSNQAEELEKVKGQAGAGGGNTAKSSDGLAFRKDLRDHLAGPDGFTKSGQLSGTHNLNNATSALDARGAKYTVTPTGTPGISELKYTYTDSGTGKLVSGSKTVYDPAVISDETMLDDAQKAGQTAWEQYQQNPGQKVFNVSEGGVNFRAYINFDTNGTPYIGNVHPIK